MERIKTDLITHIGDNFSTTSYPLNYKHGQCKGAWRIDLTLNVAYVLLWDKYSYMYIQWFSLIIGYMNILLYLKEYKPHLKLNQCAKHLWENVEVSIVQAYTCIFIWQSFCLFGF